MTYSILPCPLLYGRRYRKTHWIVRFYYCKLTREGEALRRTSNDLRQTAVMVTRVLIDLQARAPARLLG